MQVIIAGTGKLATELRQALGSSPHYSVTAWAQHPSPPPKAIVVHAGSGRELGDIAAYCEASASPLLELSTGSAIENQAPGFPVVLCPNTNILMLKFMAMLAHSGAMFKSYDMTLIESHQAGKTSVPGTAVSMAQSLGLQAEAIQSIRDTQIQQTQLQIAEADLPRHAYHQILIQDGACSVKLETRVTGDSPYAHGVDQIIRAVMARELEHRIYPVMAFIEYGWL